MQTALSRLLNSFNFMIIDNEEISKKLLEDNFKSRVESEKEGVLIINYLFDQVMMEHTAFKLIKMAGNKAIDEIKIYINSNGGEVSALLPLIDIIDSIKKPVRTIVMGKAYSCGALLLICGHKGYREAYKNSDILIHEVASDRGYAKNSQIQHDAKYIQRLNLLLAKIIKERTKMKDAEIKKYMESNSDIFITAKDALRYGLIDKII